ncbi:MAG TPA: phage baseplate assembly protein V [Acetobacteraceae bacterium]|jgi:phage baseplate assembly protein gpV|nr:phage baseplate assembly protein V [Acetobacteraceae bacterium]
MQRFLNTMKAHASALDGATGQPRFGLVTSVDPERYAARVSLQPEGVISGWLPILSPWVGAGWGVSCLPSPGDQVLVVPQEGQAEHGVVLGGSWSDSARPPGAPAGELWLKHKSGATLKLANDGTVQIIGDLHVSGDVYDGKGSLDRLRQHYDQHVHPGIGARTSAPD